MTALLLCLLTLGGAIDANPLFVEGKRRFDAFDLQGALARFELVLLDDALPARERAYVLLWRGRTEAELGRFEAAGATFEAAVLLDEQVALPPETSPKVQAMLEAARRRAAEREPPAAPEVATTTSGRLHPRGPGVLIRTTPGGRMEARVQEAPPPPPPDPSPAAPWLLGAGIGSAGASALALGSGGLLLALALTEERRADAGPSAAGLGAGVALAGGAALLLGAGLALGLWALQAP